MSAPVETGRLLVVATPIGNLGDITHRALAALAEADIIVAEDTRVTRKLLAHFEIDTPLERYDEHTAIARTPVLVGRIAEGARVALVSDAGTPGISDPGERLVDAAIDADLRVEVIPGASAIVTALVASGLPTHAFYFGGFLPRKMGERARALESLAGLDATLVFYESPKRAAATLAAIADAFPTRRGALARELTKLHEEVVRAPMPQLAALIAERESIKGEVVVLVGPPTAEETAGAHAVDDTTIVARVRELEASGVRRSEAVKQVAAELGVPKKRVYALALGA